MKAKEYISQYVDETEAAKALEKEFQEMRKKRSIKTKDGWNRLYREFSEKAAIIEQALGFKPGFFHLECDL